MSRRPRANDELANIGDVRVIDDAGQMLGVMSANDAIRLARARGLDLVEIRADEHPPICKILSLAKFKMPDRPARADIDGLIACGRRLAKILGCPAPPDADLRRVIAQIVLERDPVVALELGLITRAEGRDLLLAGLVDYIRDHAGDTPISETWHDDDLYRSVEEALFVSWR